MTRRTTMLTSTLRATTALLLTGLLLADPPPALAAAPTTEPRLAEAARSAELLDVRVWVRAETPAVREFTPREIRDLHQPGLEALSARIRELERGSERLGDGEQEQLEALREALDERLDEMRREVAAAVHRRPAGNRRAVAQWIERLGGRLRGELPLANALSATIPAGALPALAEHPLVARVAEDRPTELELNVSVDSLGTGFFWNATPTPIIGGTVDFGVVDTGVQQDHPALSSHRFFTNTQRSTDPDSDGHGTHVTGIVASTDQNFTGGAYGLDAVIWSSLSWDDALANASWVASDAAETPEVINTSWGRGSADDVGYSDEDSFFDALVQHFDVLITKSAGNEGWSETGTTLTHPANAYNLLSVANMNDRGTQDRTDDVRSTSSSVGPTLDGRRKPDLAAPGTSIFSANSSWRGQPAGGAPDCGVTADDFCPQSGTSMAAPHVASAVLLLADAGVHVPMAQRAILINAADAWDSNGTSTTTDDGPIDGSLWDKSYGWGYLDMAEAFLNRHDYFLGSVAPQSDATHADHKLYKGAMATDEKATLVWEKRADQYVDGDAASGRRRLTNLDLRLYRESDGASLDLDVDKDDNVHQVAAPENLAPAIVKVSAADGGFDGASLEPFALATEEGFQAITPPTFQHSYGAPAWVRSSQGFEVKAHALNLGGAAAHATTLALGGRTGVTGTGTKSVPAIPAGGGTAPTAGVGTATFALATSGLAEGSYWLPLTIESRSYGELYRYQSTSGVLIKVDATAPKGVCGSAAKSRGTIQVAFTASDAKSGVERSHLYVKGPGQASFTSALVSATGTSGTLSYTPLQSGVYQFAVRSQDKAGNWEAAPISSECSSSY